MTFFCFRFLSSFFLPVFIFLFFVSISNLCFFLSLIFFFFCFYCKTSGHRAYYCKSMLQLETKLTKIVLQHEHRGGSEKYDAIFCTWWKLQPRKRVRQVQILRNTCNHMASCLFGARYRVSGDASRRTTPPPGREWLRDQPRRTREEEDKKKREEKNIADHKISLQ